RDAEGPVVEPRPDGGDRGAVMDRDRDPVVARLERGLEVANHAEVRLEALDAPLPGERGGQSGEVAAGLGQLGLLDLDLVQPDDRIDDEVAHGHALAHDLAVDLALRRHVDEDVALDVRTAAEAPTSAKAAQAVVFDLVRATRREVRIRRLDSVLREGTLGGHDLASPAQAPAA